MARLSNFLRPDDGNGDGHGNGSHERPAVECRPAQRAEIEPALRLILAGASGLADDDAVLDFLSFAVHRKIDVNATWVATDGRGVVVWALLPIVSPGRTMLLLTPGRLPVQTPPRAVRLLADAVCRHLGGARRLALAQLLLDPADRTVGELYRNAGFDELATLAYLQRRLSGAGEGEAPAIPNGWTLAPYSRDTHALFADTILRSYEASLDCPALNGLRDVEDVIAGHKAAGTFDPSMWFALSERGAGRGVLLLNPTSAGESVELVYLGLTPESRGRGLGDQLMRLALDATARRDFGELSLAVDSRNAPAMKLYHRHGMKHVGSRLALVRDLRRARP